MSAVRLILVGGLSGSGKSTAMAALEDLGFYCADHLPAPLIEQFLDLATKSTPPLEKIALALAAREAQGLEQIPAVVEHAKQAGYQVDLLYLECAEQELARRFRETRRVHPLSPDGSVADGIRAERERFRELAALADHTIDTTSLNVHQLKAAVVLAASGQPRPAVVNVVSFGFRHGTPEAVEQLFDVRFLPNPYFEPELRPHSGREPAVSEFVLRSERGEAFFAKLLDWLAFLLPLYDAEGKAYMTIGFGCTGGRHRSVALAEATARELRQLGREVNVTHRDVEKSA